MVSIDINYILFVYTCFTRFWIVDDDDDDDDDEDDDENEANINENDFDLKQKFTIRQQKAETDNLILKYCAEPQTKFEVCNDTRNKKPRFLWPKSFLQQVPNSILVSLHRCRLTKNYYIYVCIHVYTRMNILNHFYILFYDIEAQIICHNERLISMRLLIDLKFLILSLLFWSIQRKMIFHKVWNYGLLLI